MTKSDAIGKLKALDRIATCVLTKGDLEKLFPDEAEKTLEKSLQRLVAGGILERVSKGVYVNRMTSSKGRSLVEDIAVVLRRGYFSYVSMASILSEYGLISQIPVRRLTVMTTGAKGVYATPYGTIEFTHTKRRPAEILRRTLMMENRPLRIASRQAAMQDLRRAGRNTSMLATESVE